MMKSSPPSDQPSRCCSSSSSSSSSSLQQQQEGGGGGGGTVEEESSATSSVVETDNHEKSEERKQDLLLKVSKNNHKKKYCHNGIRGMIPNLNAKVLGPRVEDPSLMVGKTKTKAKNNTTAAPFLRYLEEASSRALDAPATTATTTGSNSNHDSALFAEIPPLPTPPVVEQLERQTDHSSRPRGPGAYPSGEMSFGSDDMRPGELEQQTTIVIGGGGGGGGEEDTTAAGAGAYYAVDFSNTHTTNDTAGLVSARRVSEAANSSSEECTTMALEEAQPVADANRLDQLRADTRARDKKYLAVALGFVVVACLVLTLSLAFGLATEGSPSDKDTTSQSIPTLRPTVAWPPMENLEQLYQDLPNQTKQSLDTSHSPQYKAWDWLLNHPNLTTYPEWRKKQIFAMATFYYSFEGPNWPTTIRNPWMNYAKSNECEWILSNDEVQKWADAVTFYLGPGVYDPEDFQACNQRTGELQTIVLHQLFLPTHLQPSVPPQIGLLTSLRILGITPGILSGSKQLSDWLLVPELIGLPNLAGLNLRGNALRGTIPKEIGQMTKLRHLLIGGNAFSGSIPTEIGQMTSLEYFTVGDEKGLTGTLPTQFGQMTKLTGLFVFGSPEVGGRIPTQIGWLTGMKEMRLKNNALTGPIPSELVQLTNLVELHLGNDYQYHDPSSSSSSSQNNYNNYNNFIGSLPHQLWGKLSGLKDLHLSNLPNLYGSIPKEIPMPNLTTLSLGGSPHISGIIPDQICIFLVDLDFDCSTRLCGCDCECIVTTTNNSNETDLLYF